MTSELSTVVQAVITDENEKYFFVQKSGETFRLKKDDTTESLKIGDVVTGFLYENSSRKKVFTLKVPEVTNESMDGRMLLKSEKIWESSLILV